MSSSSASDVDIRLIAGYRGGPLTVRMPIGNFTYIIQLLSRRKRFLTMFSSSKSSWLTVN